MADKKYYWLKLKRDFFKRHDIRIIENMPNGKDYILFYLKLLCESIDHNGNLRFSDTIPFNAEMLATITNTNVDVVRSAIKIFEELHMIEVLNDGTYYMQEVERMIGSETEWAQKKRDYRERHKKDNVLLKEDNVLTLSDKSKSIEIDKDIEIEKEKDKEIEKKKINYQEIVDMYNDTCVSFPRLTTLSDARKKAIKARLNNYSIDDFKLLFEKAEQSTFLKGGNGRNWSATFDWLIKDSNMAKVLDGNYDNKTAAVPGQKAQELNDFYAMAQNWAESEE